MPATNARIAFVLQATRDVEATDTAIKTAYGELARDTGEAPVETFFDATGDAQTMATERLTLLKANRRRFKQDVRGSDHFSSGTLDYSQKAPTVTVIDDERAANHSALVVGASIDLARDKTSLETWG
jgi:hypothetical protein